MKRMNNKGVTLIELIVSFAIVSVAIIYFFQTLYTVKKVYSIARKETNTYVDKDYTYRILDAYFEEKSLFDTDNLCGDLGKYNLPCTDIKYIEYSNGMNHYTINFDDGSTGEFYKLKNIMNEFELDEENSKCTFGCAINTTTNSDIHVSGNGLAGESYLYLKVKSPKNEIAYKKLVIERYRNLVGLNCSYTINNSSIKYYDNIGYEHVDDIYDSGGTLNGIKVTHPGGVNTWNTCYATIKYIKFKTS